MKRKTNWLAHGVGVLALAAAGSISAGPIIIGGDDLTDHGSVAGGVNQQGWKYIEKAVDNILGSVSRSGPFTVDIAALGSASSSSTCCNAGAAIGSAAGALGKTVGYYDGAANIDQFFTDLASSSVNPAMLYLPGTGASNDLDSSEGASLTSHASEINAFVASGGGLLAHGSGSTAFGWLQTLLPGITFPSGCSANGAQLTMAGQAAFPGLSNSDIDGNAGPCHNHFENIGGGLTVLALDGQQRAYIIGANTAGGSITNPGVPGVPEPGMLALLGIGLAGFAGIRRKTI